MYISINNCGDFGHDPTVVDAVVAAFARRIREAIARGDDLRYWDDIETVHGRVYRATINLFGPYADEPYVVITEL